MRKKLFSIVVALLILVILFIVVNYDNSSLGAKLKQVTKYINNWLDIDWESIKRWMSA